MAALASRAQVQGPYAERNDVAAATAASARPQTGATFQATPPHSISSNNSSVSTASPPSSGPTSPQQATVPLPPRKSLDPQQRPVQIGRPKPVGFVPAALRPTERPRVPKQDGKSRSKHHSSQSHSGPPSPPQSLDGSTDSLSKIPSAGSSTKGGSRNSSATNVRPASIDTTARPISSRATSSLSSPTASLSSLSLTGLATGAALLPPHPTKAHWKPDAMAPTCDALACPVVFSTFTRRHHCRRCGGVFCHRHASRQVLLDGDARMVATPALSTTTTNEASSAPGTPRTTTAPGILSGNSAINWVNDPLITPDSASLAGDEGIQMRSDVGMWRACDNCHAEWTNWTEGLREEAEKAKATGGLGPYLHLPADIAVPVDGAGRKSSVVGSAAGSVPRDWTWSTF